MCFDSCKKACTRSWPQVHIQAGTIPVLTTEGSQGKNGCCIPVAADRPSVTFPNEYKAHARAMQMPQEVPNMHHLALCPNQKSASKLK